jgi:acyl-CoA thioesterase-1
MLLAGLFCWIATCPEYARGSPEAKPAKTIVFLGDSLTAGLGLELSQAYPALVEGKVEALGLPFQVVNAGLSGDTTAGGLRRIDWLLRRPIDVLVIALGGNDGLRGVSPEATRSNLQGIIDKAKARQPGVKILVAGMQMPPNMGEDYASRFRGVFPAVAETNHAALIPFLLAGVGGVPELNQPDKIHPTAEGQKKLAENVWAVLLPVLRRD